MGGMRVFLNPPLACPKMDHHAGHKNGDLTVYISGGQVFGTEIECAYDYGMMARLMNHSLSLYTRSNHIPTANTELLHAPVVAAL